jgi:hypothetical protein
MTPNGTCETLARGNGWYSAQSASGGDTLTMLRRNSLDVPSWKKSVALLPMPSDLEAMLRDYLKNYWKENPNQLLFPAPGKDGFARSRNDVVRSGLKPILRELGISAENVGLHAFRHGLVTELAESEPITVLQTQMRHADVRTTLKVYAHVIPQSQRDSMERIARRSIGTNVPIGTGAEASKALKERRLVGAVGIEHDPLFLSPAI